MQYSSADAKADLRQFAFNQYSQFGEDGVLAKIFDEIGVTSGLCVEFGAWDGFHLSNTARLWTNGWKAVLIEADKRRFKSLVKNVSGYAVTCINEFVGHGLHDSLEAILRRHQIIEPIDFLSIDIDGDDYYVLQSLEEIRPRLIVCEYNPSIPAELDLFAEPGGRFGCSAAALERVARSKGYGLVAMTDTNCFFVREADLGCFANYETRLREIKIDSHLVHLMTSYTGDYIVSRVGPYGFAFPYRGRLYGSFHFVRFHATLLGPLFRVWRRLKAVARRLLARAGCGV